jgi:hypothetical protein
MSRPLPLPAGAAPADQANLLHLDESRLTLGSDSGDFVRRHIYDEKSY